MKLAQLTFVIAKAPVHAMWYCSNCGSPNTVSEDEGCTSCNF